MSNEHHVDAAINALLSEVTIQVSAPREPGAEPLPDVTVEDVADLLDDLLVSSKKKVNGVPVRFVDLYQVVGSKPGSSRMTLANGQRFEYSVRKLSGRGDLTRW